MAKSTNLDEQMEAEMEGMEDSEEEDQSDEEGPDPAAEARLAELEEELRVDPYSYRAHEETVGLLKKGEDLDGLRAARQRFSEHYPLTSQLWLDWIGDEQRIAATPEDQQAITALFQRGVRDYLSVDLWLEYCMGSMSGLGTVEGQAAARAVHEAAIAACGLHVAQGALVWAAYRELEGALLAVAPAGEETVRQRARLDKVWARQLRQPLVGLDAALVEYREWSGGAAPDPVLLAASRQAGDRLKKRAPHEAAVAAGEAGKRVAAWRAYIALERAEGEPARVQCVFERAVAEHCLEATLWREYTDYLEAELKIEAVILPVYSRALRNCPWETELWCQHMRALERYERPVQEVTRVFEQALAAGSQEPAAYLELWLALIDCRRRAIHFQPEVTPSMEELRAVFERARLHLADVGGDPGHEVAKYQANLEADQYGSMDVARQIWAAILQAEPGSARLWLEFIQLEKTFGDKKHLRKAFQRALEKTYDQPELIAKAFLQFEREEGSLEAWEGCRKACSAKLARAEGRQAKLAGREQEEAARRQGKVEVKKEKDKQYRRDKRQEDAAAKREAIDAGLAFKRPLPAANANGSKPNVPLFKMKPKVEAPPGFKAPPGFNEKKRSMEPPPGFKEPAVKRQKMVSDEEFESLSETKQKELRTIFLSNLSYEVDDGLVKETMGASGAVAEVRLVKTPAGKSKGYAFVEFETKEAARAALDRDNEQMNGRPMYISECNQKKKEEGAAGQATSFKFKTELEKNKLFVRGIDQTVSQEELRELFAQHGALAGVRLVTYRNGHSKGIAFIDYQKEEDAAVALIKTDGTKLKDGVLEVALSNPPKRAEEAAPAPDRSQVRSLGGSQQEPGPRGRGRSQLALFTPRVLTTAPKGQAAAKLAPMKFVKPGGGGGAGGPEAEAAPAGEEAGHAANGAAKSNSDFRSMFLK